MALAQSMPMVFSIVIHDQWIRRRLAATCLTLMRIVHRALDHVRTTRKFSLSPA